MTPDQKPIRLRLSRVTGFKLQQHSQATNGLPARVVVRPGKWGNHAAKQASLLTGAEAVEVFRYWIENIAGPEWKAEAIQELRGKNLACFCRLDVPCHADVLLELVNDTAPAEAQTGHVADCGDHDDR
jgi:Domain of unknown function (DUF4326)